MKYKRTLAMLRLMRDGFDLGHFSYTIQHLENQSAKGWQLVKAGLLCYRFVRDSSTNYLYAFTDIGDEMFTHYNSGNEWSFITRLGQSFIYRKAVPQDLVRLEKQFDRNEMREEQAWLLEQMQNRLYLCRCDDHVYTFARKEVNGNVKYLVGANDDLPDFELYLKGKKDEGWHFIGKDQNRCYFDDDFPPKRKGQVSLSNADLENLFKRSFLTGLYILTFLLICFGFFSYYLYRQHLQKPESVILYATLFWMAMFMGQIIFLIHRYRTFHIETELRKRKRKV